MIARRNFLTGFGAFLAAPAIVQIQNIMPIKALPPVETLERYLHQSISLGYTITREAINQNLYDSAFGTPPPFQVTNMEIWDDNWEE